MDRLRAEGIVKSEEDWQEPVYQKSGIGRLMIASSLTVLNAKGITTANLGHLSDLAERSWKPFGNEEGKLVNVAETVKSEAVFNSTAGFI